MSSRWPPGAPSAAATTATILDSDPAKQHFELLREKGALRAERIAFVGDVDGYPLWRYGGAP